MLLRNLVDNAIRYSPPGSRIRIAATQTPQHTVLQVEDSGPGLDDAQRERLGPHVAAELAAAGLGRRASLIGSVGTLEAVDWAGVTLVVEPTGAQTHVVFSLAGEPATAVVDGAFPARYGTPFEAAIAADQVHVFDQQSGLSL